MTAVVWTPGTVVPAPLNIYTCKVEQDWVDYNGHMTEAAYLTAMGWGSDALFTYIGDNDEYRAAGNSFYTVETHIVYEDEAFLISRCTAPRWCSTWTQSACTFTTSCSILKQESDCRTASKCWCMLT
jgi:acyl-CoA thioesterase FadM